MLSEDSPRKKTTFTDLEEFNLVPNMHPMNMSAEERTASGRMQRM